MSGTLLWGVAIIVGIAAVAVAAILSRRKLTVRRQPIELESMRTSLAGEVDSAAFRDVLEAIGRAYAIDPRLLRPDDDLQSLLRADSWLLDSGTEKLNLWLCENGLSEDPIVIGTVLDLVRLVEQHRRQANLA